MNKILLIIKREYLTRVRKRSFIIMTLLGPLLMGAIIPISIYLQSSGSDEKTNIIVIDNSKEALYARQLSFANKDGMVQYYPDTSSIDLAKKNFDSQIYYGILHIFELTGDSISYELFTPKLASMSKVESIRSSIQKIADEEALVKNDIDPLLLAALKKKVKLKQTSIVKSETNSSNATLTSILAFVSGILIYMFIFIYGAQVMRGVMEEKSSRIVEVIMSSVKPFQLMMGKIIGIAMVALTQFILWALLTFGVAAVSISFMADKMGTSKEAMAKQVGTQQPGMGANPMMNADQLEDNEIVKNLQAYDFKSLGLAFVFYFLFGYLLYASLFAAVGAAVDAETDVQQFMLPITIPLIFAYIAAAAVMQNPDSPIGFWCSIFPFTSPIVMMVRMPFEPPAWEIALSMILLAITFILITMLAAKIYRTGILMYGKKVTWKELLKWLRY